MRALFIGGTGNISSACLERALLCGWQVTLLNRGRSAQPGQPGVTTVIGDRNDPSVLERAAASLPDVVADFVGYTPEQVERDIAAFSGKTSQYLYISSASAYRKPLPHYLITEDTPLGNPYWQYARDKIACEHRLMQAFHETGFPVTIVRPSYTYGPTWIPAGLGGHGYTIVERMLRRAPVISHGDGQSLWVLTHTSDFAVGFVGLMGNAAAAGEAFHITSDEVLTWDAIYQVIGQAAGCGDAPLVHIPSDWIAQVYPDWGAGLLGDKMHSVVYDNSKIKRFVPEYRAVMPFGKGIALSLAWHHADPVRCQADAKANARMDDLIARFNKLV
ncbi:MAG: SDR family oxidoreductase [Anaerolineae bacterium]